MATSLRSQLQGCPCIDVFAKQITEKKKHWITCFAVAFVVPWHHGKHPHRSSEATCADSLRRHDGLDFSSKSARPRNLPSLCASPMSHLIAREDLHNLLHMIASLLRASISNSAHLDSPKEPMTWLDCKTEWHIFHIQPLAAYCVPTRHPKAGGFSYRNHCGKGPAANHWIQETCGINPSFWGQNCISDEVVDDLTVWLPAPQSAMWRFGNYKGCFSFFLTGRINLKGEVLQQTKTSRASGR